MADLCYICSTPISDDRHVLVVARVHQAHCSDACLQRNVRKRGIARAASRRRWMVRLAALVLVPVSAFALWRRYHAPPGQAISLAWAEVRREPAPAGPPPIVYGPNWPPTDEEWLDAFIKLPWVYPLPGPVRRPSRTDAKIFSAEAGKGPAPRCRTPGRCGVDLGGDIWGEHVYAALDGVVDRVHGDGNEDHGGLYVRVVHLGGMLFSQYFHLAAVPRTVYRGAHVRAGDVIGLLGDTGLPHPTLSTSPRSPRHLHFTLSVRPSADFPEVFWDPTAWMSGWPLRIPSHGSVAGLVPVAEKIDDAPLRRRRAVR